MTTNTLKLPTLPEIDEIRQSGFRPQVVGCIVYGKQILFVFAAKHNLWQLPQGGIDNCETIIKAFRREMAEELGEKFMTHVEVEDIKLVGDDLINFPKKLQGQRELVTDNGKNLSMVGKKYFFIVAKSKTDDLNINHTEFDDYQWLTFNEAMALTDKIYQKNKKQLTIKALNELKKQNFI